MEQTVKVPRVNLAVQLAGLTLQNPVMPASGTFGFGEEYAPFIDLNSLGAIVVKTITLQPLIGNPPPRLMETYCGLLNSVGLQNPGLEVFIRDKLPYLRRFSPPLIVNIAGRTIDEYAELAERLSAADGVAALEVNISCPNVKEGGIVFGTVPDMAARVTAVVKRHTHLPVIIKLTPNVTDITEIARAVEDAGADALSLINTVRGMAIDIKTRRPALANVVGGLSGPAIKPIALYAVWQVAQVVKIPLIGMGGIMTAHDAVEFLLAGATAVAVGTAGLVNPGALCEIIAGLEHYLLEEGVEDIKELIGASQM
ncbi:Dihydroorotate dehydrogenase, class 1/ 2 [Moorella glycerini]|uniref:Dihydroorotate dehydrogenase n=1 Tax=Neomoorella stamsii TaxID=1266720 RepID=A0A9X7P6F0_9FIRM|nr:MULTISPECIES: dihydroorotate dehydrogenase [Moorella]PRR73461.1 Dihydroorotate dehydrogenase B, catalytic subunit [Moorella stamsii]CEP69230.1 Dihydroorotate dehydrogenase, class 1/ 2 [Moorella glycerini]